MNKKLSQRTEETLLSNPKTFKKLEFMYQKNKEQDNSPDLDRLSKLFKLKDCRDSYWNPENFSLFYKTPLWDQASEAQRVKLNQLYWVAYYAQIISAEIATIFFNQTAAAGLYGIEDFRIVCDTLDLESKQERAHIDAFKKISEDYELEVFGERLFTYPMRSPYVETMIFNNSNRVKAFWRAIQMRAFTLLSSGNAFIGSQYFTVRGLRTLNGKIVQHQLSKFYTQSENRETAPIPSKVSYDHFLDESFHFSTSMVVGRETVMVLKAPTAFEKSIVNKMFLGCQRDHYNFSTAINGIFWFDPAIYSTTYRLLRSHIFGMEHGEALKMMKKVYCEESEGMHLSAQTHRTATESYKEFLAILPYVNRENKEMRLMSSNHIERHLRNNRAAFARFHPSPFVTQTKVLQDVA